MDSVIVDPVNVDPAIVDPVEATALRTAARRESRQRRRRLPSIERRAASRAIAHHLGRTGWLRPDIRLAAYCALPEEVDVSDCIAMALRRGAQLWLPRLESARRATMAFAPAWGPIRINRFGIPEPATSERLSARWLQLVLMPLVAWDLNGTRLGMGGGYYDRALAWRRLRVRWRGPLLVGIAHSTQQVDLIPALAHDIRLDAVITEHGVIRFPEACR